MAAYTTHIVKEVIYSITPKTHISQICKEILYSQQGNSKLSQLIIETLYSTPSSISVPSSGGLVTQIVIEVLRNS